MNEKDENGDPIPKSYKNLKRQQRSCDLINILKNIGQLMKYYK
jgi:hypothetical protein